MSLEQSIIYTAARQSIVDMLLPHGKDDNKDQVISLVKKAGTLKWRRSLSSETIETTLDHLGNAVSSGDENKLEWLTPTLIRFISYLGKDWKDHPEVDNLVESIYSTYPLDDFYTPPTDEHPDTLTVDRGELKDVLVSQPIVLFMFALYHSDIRKYLG